MCDVISLTGLMKKWKGYGDDSFLEVTSMCSVFPSLSLSMFAVAHALPSLIHDCIE